MPETSIRSGSSRRAAAIGGSAGQIHMEFGTFHCDIGVGIRSQCGLLASGTSPSVSKQQGPMQGPSAASSSAGRLP